MKLLVLVLMCLLSFSTFGGYVNKPTPLFIEKVDVDTFRLLLASSSIQSKVKTLILGYLEEKQTPSSLTDLMVDIKTVVFSSAMKGSIENPSIEVDEKKFLEQSIFHFKVTFTVPYCKEKEAQLEFEFKVELEDE